MALANKRALNKETKSNPFYPEKLRGEDSPYRSISCSPLDLFSYKDQPSLLEKEEESGSNQSLRAYYGGFAPTQYDSSSSSYGNFVSGGANNNSAIQEANSWMESKSNVLDNWAYSSSSVLSFDREEECANWVGAADQNFLLHANSSAIEDGHEGVEQEKASQKRAHACGEVQASKKQCVANKKAKAKQPITPKDPQSVAAKVRRERISERLKVLQELVPNGTKVDLVTMLEKAIGYVKFLQLQVKVLATDEFWPTQGGKAPNLSQVKEAIDAILYSQRSDSSKD